MAAAVSGGGKDRGKSARVVTVSARGGCSGADERWFAGERCWRLDDWRAIVTSTTGAGNHRGGY